MSPMGDIGHTCYHRSVTLQAAMTPDDKPEPRRNREATSARVIAAAATILARDGAAALGVNALAKEAGCDKQLIYRYFDGLEGVMAALGEAVAERLANHLAETADGPATDWPAFSQNLARGLLSACRADPLLGRIRAAEFVRPPGRLAPFVAARGRVLQDWVSRTHPLTQPPPGVDIPALHALLAGAIEAATLAAAASGALVGLPLQSEAHWARLDRSLTALIAAAYRGAA